MIFGKGKYDPWNSLDSSHLQGPKGDSIAQHFQREPQDQFFLPMSAQAFEEYETLLQNLQAVHLSDKSIQGIFSTKNIVSLSMQQFFVLAI
uniref:Uncharacterized protein n=1 Tax=Oryza punctata TaxID=4537 RepID=A0A0E0JIY6_ORYPU